MMFGLGNPKGEVIKCRGCDRWHDILRGTMCYCACGKEVKSKEYLRWNKENVTEAKLGSMDGY